MRLGVREGTSTGVLPFQARGRHPKGRKIQPPGSQYYIPSLRSRSCKVPTDQTRYHTTLFQEDWSFLYTDCGTPSACPEFTVFPVRLIFSSTVA